MPSIFAPQTPVANDSGAVTLSFQGAPNVLYDRTMTGNTTYTISTAGTSGGETMSLTLRGPYQYSFASSVAISWAGGMAPTPACSASAFDRIKFEVLQDGTLLGMQQALGASVPYVSPTHYLEGSSTANIYCSPENAQNITGGFLDAIYHMNVANSSSSESFGGKWPQTLAPTLTNSEFLGQLNSSGCPIAYWFESGMTTEMSATCYVSLSSVIENNQDAWVQYQINISGSSVTPVQGNLAPLASACARFSYSTNGAKWTQLGATVTGLAEGNFSEVGANAANVIFGSAPPYATFSGKLYGVTIRDGSGAIRYNPDITTLSSGQTGTFTDTAATPNVWNINGTIN
jgi:hypothetical protein